MTNSNMPLTTVLNRIELSEVLSNPNDVESNKDKLQRRTLTPLVWYYIAANAAVDIMIFVFAYSERVHPSFGEHIITADVLRYLIVGNTVQVAAMIVAAFKGLFDSKIVRGEAKGDTNDNTR